MKLILVSLLLISVAKTVTDGCALGCLRCDTKNKTCDICDSRRNFERNASGGCEVYAISNCKNADFNGGCYECLMDYYFDASTNVCIIVPALIPDCRAYTGPTTCSVCRAGYYLSENTCVFIARNARISGCVINSSIDTCYECRSGFVPSYDRKSCNAAQINNCDLYRNYYCNRCDSDKTLVNRNSYLTPFHDYDDKDNMRAVALKLFTGSKFAVINSICVATAVTNCVIYTSFNKCHACADGYYVETDGTCGKYIESNMSGCQVYVSKTVCAKCNSEVYYLKDDGCEIATAVQNCLNYAASADSCAECDNGFYLSAESCTERTKLIASCDHYVVDKEECTKCLSGYQLTDDGSTCFSLPLNCTQADTDEITCLKCDDGYYYNGTGCAEGTVPNCEKFADDNDVCTVCSEGYVLNGSQACVVRETTIENCFEYLTTLPSRCEICDFKSVLFEQTSVCDQITKIDNCASYSDATTCEKCEPNYVLDTNSCALIPADENCVEKSADVCVLCTESYELIRDNCVVIPAQYSENCAVADPETVGVTFDCIGCDNTAIPIKNILEICVESSSQSFGTIANCAKYLTDTGGSYICSYCTDGYILSKDGDDCLESCPADQVQYAGAIAISAGDISVEPFSRCYDLVNFADLPAGCKIASHELNGNKNFCLKCDTGYVPIESCALNNSFFNGDDLSEMREGQAFSVVGCQEQPDSATFKPTSSEPDDLCQHYTPFGDKFYCTQCKFGYTGPIQTDGDGKMFIACSTPVTDCNLEARIGSGFTDNSWLADMYGFSLTYNYTCHVCTDSTKIPFIHLDNRGNLAEYQLNSTDDVPSEASTKDGEMTVCRAPDAEGLNVSATQFTGFVDNCALGLVVVDITKKVSTGASSARCLACKDGYKRVLDSTGFYIESCLAIANCNSQPTSGWFEGCKSCDSTHAKIVSGAGVIDPNDCSTEYSDENCRIFDPTNNICANCERGYYLDSDNNCIKLDIPFCPGYAQNAILYYQVPDVKSTTGNIVDNYSYAYYFGATGFDCHTCAHDFVAGPVSSNNELCALYPEIATGTSAYLISQCESYYLDSDSEMRCRSCATGFIVDSDNAACHDDTGLTGCNVAAISGTSCDVCSGGYQLGGGACFAHNITNCNTYGYENSSLVCKECNLEYILDSDTCTKGNITNCGIYNVDSSCKTCLNGYYLLADACIQIPSSTNCDQVTLLMGDSPKFLCNSCEDDYIVNSTITSSDHTLCLEGLITTDCAEYDSEFVCQACDASYYLSGTSCVQRELDDDNCVDYKTNADECDNCLDGYYTEDGACVKNIYNTSFCKYYRLSGTCLFCLNSKYIDASNECTAIAANNLIGNCEYYNPDMTCFKCESTYVMIADLCYAPVAANCAQYANDKTCSSCPSGHYLKVRTSGGNRIRDCISSTIVNCLELNPMVGTCRVCDKNYYPKAFTCVIVPIPIANCRVAKINSCEVCDKGYIKTFNNDECILDTTVSTLESNCTDLRYSNNPVCTACKVSTLFSGSSCVICYTNETEKTANIGCRYCQPTERAKCLMCNSGYYMNSTGVCIVTPSTSGLSSINDDNYDEGTSVFTTLSILISVLFVIIH